MEIKELLEAMGFEKILDGGFNETYFRATEAPLGIAVLIWKDRGNWELQDSENFNSAKGKNAEALKAYLADRLAA